MPAPLVATRRPDVDAIAAGLASWARTFRDMPPSFAGAGDTLPMLVPGVGVLGAGLPGHGLILRQSLRGLGVRRPIPGVYDRPVWERAAEQLQDHAGVLTALALAGLAAAHGMDGTLEGAPLAIGAIANLNDIIAARNAGKGYDLYWDGTGNFNTAVGSWHAHFDQGANNGQAAFTAALGASAPNGTTPGSLLLGMPVPTAPEVAYLLGMGVQVNAAVFMGLVTDVLYECGGIPATSVGPHTLGTAALTRHTTGAGVWPALVPTTQLSNTAVTFTLTYTNTVPTGSRTSTISHPNTTNAGAVRRIIGSSPSPALQSGDYGVRSVQSVGLSGALAAGVLGLLLHKPLVALPTLGANVYAERDVIAALDGLLPLSVGTDSQLPCLSTMWQSQASSTSNALQPRCFTRVLVG